MSTHPLFAPAEPLSVASLHAATDPIAIADLDEDWAVPCEVGVKLKRANGEVCNRTAEWVAWTVRCCPERTASMFICDGHRRSLTTRAAVCHHCREPFLPGILGYRLIEPLNRRTT